MTSGSNGDNNAAIDQAVSPSTGKTVASTFGEIVWLMSQSAEHKHIPVGDLEQLVMPPILPRQFRLLYKGEQPIAAVLYARVSEEVAAQFGALKTTLAAEWQNGNRCLIVLTIATFGVARVVGQKVEAKLPQKLTNLPGIETVTQFIL